MQAWVKSAMASNESLSCGAVPLGRLWSMYSDRFTALKTLPVLIDILAMILHRIVMRDEDVGFEGGEACNNLRVTQD